MYSNEMATKFFTQKLSSFPLIQLYWYHIAHSYRTIRYSVAFFTFSLSLLCRHLCVWTLNKDWMNERTYAVYSFCGRSLRQLNWSMSFTDMYNTTISNTYTQTRDRWNCETFKVSLVNTNRRAILMSWRQRCASLCLLFTENITFFILPTNVWRGDMDNGIW